MSEPSRGRFGIRFAGSLALRSPDRPMLLDYLRTSDPVDQIVGMADLGFAGVFDNFLMLRDIEMQSAMGRAVERHGLAFGSMTLRTPQASRPDWHRRDDDARESIIRTMHVAFDAAKRVGSSHITIVSNIDSSRDRRDQIAAFVDNLRMVADSAMSNGVSLNIEPTAGLDPALLLTDMAQAVEVLELVDHPAIRLVYDTGHVLTAGDDLEKALALTRGRLGAVQLAEPGRSEIGTGDTDWRALVAAVHVSGYRGLYELEHRPPGNGVAGERALLDRLAEIDARVDRVSEASRGIAAPQRVR